MSICGFTQRIEGIKEKVRLVVVKVIPPLRVTSSLDLGALLTQMLYLRNTAHLKLEHLLISFHTLTKVHTYQGLDLYLFSVAYQSNV